MTTNHDPEHVTSILLSEITALCREVTELYGELAATRLQSANRLAAIRAALGAAADGEPDPLAYLRDELPGDSTYPGITGSGL
jgi:hypothetical protein